MLQYQCYIGILSVFFLANKRQKITNKKINVHNMFFLAHTLTLRIKIYMLYALLSSIFFFFQIQTHSLLNI